MIAVGDVTSFLEDSDSRQTEWNTILTHLLCVLQRGISPVRPGERAGALGCPQMTEATINPVRIRLHFLYYLFTLKQKTDPRNLQLVNMMKHVAGTAGVMTHQIKT